MISAFLPLFSAFEGHFATNIRLFASYQLYQALVRFRFFCKISSDSWHSRVIYSSIYHSFVSRTQPYVVSRIFMSVEFLNRFDMFNLVKTANIFIEIVENEVCIF